ncbi:MAG: TonB-dependent receptor [Saprospiraceae bacterium]|nr:TonB-dependent receptor [Saprospiraceae bacterium]
MFRILSFLSLFIPLLAFSQRPGYSGNPPKGLTGTISGLVTDSISGEAISFASVGLYDQVSGQLINGGISDASGNFRITDLPAGNYKLQVVFVGYAVKEINNLRLTAQKPDLNYGIIFLTQESQLLNEIKVVGQAPLIEARPDKIVYNAERDLTTRGGDAADVLRNVPLLAVDFDGNVSLRGSENIRILINGRPSGIFNASVADALKMMPADQIKSVEVITSPSAKYDGEGTAGIINIITKKKSIEGLAGSVELTGGTRSNRANLNMNYGKGRLGLNASGGGHYSWPAEGTSSFRREEFGIAIPSLLTQDGFNTSSRLGYRINGGAEYNINGFNTISSSISFRGHNTDNLNDVLSSYTENDIVEEVYRRTTDGFSHRLGWEWESSFRKKFVRKDQEWSMAFELDIDDDEQESEYDLAYALPLTQPNALENNIDLGDNIELTMQTDYAHPFGEDVVIETGLKATLRIIESDFSFLEFNPDVNTWVDDPLRTDIFFYDQNVYAGYVNSNIQFGEKMTLIAGLRMEVTELNGDFKTFDSPFANQYTNYLPNITLSRKTGEYNQLKISYNQRIQRPNQRNVNPYIEYNDARDISYGNPTLGPEFVQQMEISSNFFLKGNMVNISVFGRRTEDLIENLLKITDEGVSETTYENFGIRNSIGINVFGSVAITEKISFRGGFDANFWSADGFFEGEELTNTGIDYNGRLTLTWKLMETLILEGFSMFRSPTYTVQGKLPNWVMSSFAIKQDLFKRKMVVGINISQPFSENRTFEKELSGNDFYQNNTTVRPVRSIGLTLGYRFGKLDFKERSGKKKINNNDLKEEQGGDSQF